jgi:diguanylate cyclase (GGDEF)-like protein
MPASALFLHGKITRKLFLIFLASALLPVCILSLIAINRISEATNEQVSRGLEKEVKNFSYLVLERLDFAEQTLDMYRETLSPLTPEVLARGPEFHMAQKGLMVALQPLNFIQRTELQATHQRLAEGRLLMLERAEGKRYPQVYLTAALHPERIETGLVTVKLTADYVLGVWDTRNLGIDACVLDAGEVLLYATRDHLCEKLVETVSGKLQHKGNISFETDKRYFSRYRGLFLEDKFGIPNWKIAIIQPEGDIFLASVVFRNNFIVSALVVILSLSLLSIYLIRTRMAPLASIMAGIKRVSEKRYEEPVRVNSGDEFEELADAFNSMSAQVSRQLVTMASMAEIDQLILTRIKKEDIIRVVLDKTGEVINSDSIGLAILEGQDGDGKLYQFSTASKGEFKTAEVTVTARLREQLASDLVWLGQAEPEGPDLLALFPDKTRFLLLLPVVRNDQLVAVIVLGYEQKPSLDDEMQATAKSYAGRIAVALANAEWEERLFHQAHYDTLTGLPNRLSMLDRLRRTSEQARRSGESFAVLFIDMDDFKLVNDTLGHHAGDEMITLMGQRLQSCLRAGDTVARMGGDEFVLISGAFKSSESAVSAMSKVASKVMEALAQPLDIAGREIRSSSSIGIAIFPRDGHDPDSLLKNADTAMYHAKSLGRGNFQFFSEKLNAESVALMSLSSDMKRALENDEFELHFQPKVSLPEQQIVGAEALIRWNHPERGMIPPGDFIEVAERMGLISAIGNWTMNETCRQICAWREAGNEVPRISINVSAIQIHQEDLATRVIELAEAYRLDPKQLEIEIVEGVLVEDIEATTAKLQQLRDLGVHISIDDYGTGYSSLSYVRSFPVDTLKIDRCFIAKLCENSADRAIVTSTIVLAHNLGMTVVAEGVETAEQARLLQELGCDQFQGYFFSRPLAANDVTALFSKTGISAPKSA